MFAKLRVLFAVALLITCGLTSADQETTTFAAAVKQKLALLALPAPANVAISDTPSEQVVLVDVNTSDGLVTRVQDQAPVSDKSASVNFRRIILKAAPFPRVPAALANNYSAIRLEITYFVNPGKAPSVKRVEVKGGFRYVAFQGVL